MAPVLVVEDDTAVRELVPTPLEEQLDVPVIALTTASRAEVIGAGSDDLIARPLDLSLFETKVRRYLASRSRPCPSHDASVGRAA